MNGHLGELIFFGFLAAVIITPQVLKSNDRRRLYDTLRAAYEHDQPVPPELLDAVKRRGRGVDDDLAQAYAASRRGRAPGEELAQAYALSTRPAGDHDLRRGVILLAVGLGLVLVGAAFYAGLYDVGGAPQTFASFAAAGAVPGCIGLAFLGLWWFNRDKTSV